MLASMTVLIACIAAAVVLAGVVVLLVMLGRQDKDSKHQPDPWQQQGSEYPPPRPVGPSPYDHPDAGAPHGQSRPGSGPAGPPAQGQ